LNNLLILTEDSQKYTALIKAADLPRLRILAASNTEEATDLLSSCNIFLGEPPLLAKILDSANHLDWVQSSWAGIDALCQPGLRRDYALTGVKGIFGPLISEYVLAYIFALERSIFDMRANQLAKNWQPISFRLSRDISLGIVGLGSIGQHVAQTARHFGIRVTGMNRSGNACDGVEEVFTKEKLAEFLDEPDYVLITLPDTPRTKHLVNADFLRMMKSSAVLMNVGRGNVVSEADLASALDKGEIAASVLDVFETEPLPLDSPLWSMPNVYITPHYSAASFPEDVVRIFSKNYQRFLQKESLLHLIDFDRGY